VSTSPNTNIYNIEEHPSFKGAIDDIKGELKDFISTRLLLLRQEMKQKASAFKVGLPMLIAGLAGLVLCTVFLHVALLAILAVAFGGGAMAWFYSAIILFGIYAALGGAFAWMGMREIKQTGIVPTHTMRVLKQDQNWIQREAKTQL
jgi:hypothetical protein